MSVVVLQACDGAQLSSLKGTVIMQVGGSSTGAKCAIRTFFRILDKFKKWEDFQVTNNTFSCVVKLLNEEENTPVIFIRVKILN
jgi:hypothetical protein